MVSIVDIHRVTTIKDAISLANLKQSVDQRFAVPESFQDTFKQVLWNFKRPDERFAYIAKTDGNTVGALLAHPWLDYLLIREVYVSPHYGGRGIATAVFKKFIDDTGHIILEKGLKGFYAQLVEILDGEKGIVHNEISLKLLRRLGFKYDRDGLGCDYYIKKV